jgi:serine/threonine protein kinase
MNADESAWLEEQFPLLLAACDEALAAGAPAESLSQAGAPAGLRPRLEREVAWCELVRRLWPAGDPGTLPTVSLAESPPPPVPPLARLGRFRIVRELGHGAFGVVFLAHDLALGREVALKVPRAEALVTPEVRARFQQEARAAAGLDHPNLVPVYDAGEEGPLCYIASAYCPGVTLAAWLKARAEPVPPRTAARLVATLAGAVEHAHRRGVLHRDLKPGNVMLDSSGAGPGDDLGFTPRLTDFGLAKFADGGAGVPAGCQTQSGAILGTPSYMAPEQAGGQSKAVGPAADVYALGAILYDILTGRPPFRADSTLETLLLVRLEEPVPPARLRPRLPRDLETVCLKCLHKDPARRYGSAQDLADDLQRFLDGRPVKARRVGPAGSSPGAAATRHWRSPFSWRRPWSGSWRQSVSGKWSRSATATTGNGIARRASATGPPPTCTAPWSTTPGRRCGGATPAGGGRPWTTSARRPGSTCRGTTRPRSARWPSSAWTRSTPACGSAANGPVTPGRSPPWPSARTAAWRPPAPRTRPCASGRCPGGSASRCSPATPGA